MVAANIFVIFREGVRAVAHGQECSRHIIMCFFLQSGGGRPGGRRMAHLLVMRVFRSVVLADFLTAAVSVFGFLSLSGSVAFA